MFSENFLRNQSVMRSSLEHKSEKVKLFPEIALNPHLSMRGRGVMAKMLKCREIGLDCGFIARADTEEEIMRQIAEHAHITHGVKDIPEKVLIRVRGVIRDV
jgi:predicted small metal-binding protein